MSAPRSLLVTGATGKQGGALITALLSKPKQPFKIYALTRDSKSSSAQRLASKGVTIIQGDLKDSKAVLAQVPHPWGVFSVQTPENVVREEALGKGLTAAAIDAGVKHLVYTSVERGGPEKSDADPTIIPHFISKYNIEVDLKERAAKTEQDMTWTIIRPVGFMDNLTPNFLGKGFMAMWSLNGLDHKLQLVATVDIGKVAAEAFLNADSEMYRNKALSLAGDDLSPAQAAKIFKEQFDKDIPNTYAFVGRFLRWILHEQLGIMFNWFKSDGFGADVKQGRETWGLMDFGTWLKTESQFKQ